MGVVQEQHPERARLYAQWRRLDWPIFVDSLNLLNLSGVPIPLLLDRSGVVRAREITAESVAAIVEGDFPAAEGAPRAAEPEGAAALFFKGDLDGAVEGFRAAGDARSLFRLGVALRRRAESAGRKPTDAQEAVDAWGRALAQNPNQYIWRRRLQQYGPRLDKPYDFYSWVEEARREIRARGEAPVDLPSEPAGSELLAPGKPVEPGAIPNPDPDGRLARDAGALVTVEPVVTPARVRPGHRVRVRLTLRPAASYWNNEADRLTLSAALPASLTLVEGGFVHAPPREAETRETRVMEFEASVARDAAAGTIELPAYLVYGVCETAGGVCRLLRQDVKLAVTVDPKAASIQ